MYQYAHHVILYYAHKFGPYSTKHEFAIWAYYVKPDYAQW